MKDISDLLDDVEAFDGLTDEQRSLIAGCGGLHRAAAGEMLFREGDPADAFYLVRSGKVALEVHAPAGPPLVIETLGEGEVVGWSWLVSPYRWAFDGRVVEDVATIEFDAACLRGKADDDPVLGYALLQRFSAIMLSRLQSARVRLLDLYGTTVPR